MRLKSLSRMYVETSKPESCALGGLKDRELSAVTFVRDYLQLHFDGPRLTAYTWPRIVTAAHSLGLGMPGYRDQLCAQIGKTIVSAVEEAEKLCLGFDGDVRFEISLRSEDRIGVEAAMLVDGQRWNVW